MSNEALTLLRKVWVPGPAKAVAIVLADHADDRSWSCFVSQETIAFETGLSRRTVQRALDRLKAEGLIWIEERYGSQFGRDSNVTHLMRERWTARATRSKYVPPATATTLNGAGASPPSVTPTLGFTLHGASVTREANELNPR